MASHSTSVYVPLPTTYAGNNQRTSTVTFMGDMCKFLNEFELIHTSHPDRFFDLAADENLEVQNKSPSSVDAAVETADTLQHSRERLRAMCFEFGKELTLTNFASLPDLIVSGPKQEGPLRDYFEATERLKINRDYKQFMPTDVIEKHLGARKKVVSSTASSSSSCACEHVSSSACCNEKRSDSPERERVRDALIGVGMCTKKRHEVVQMHKAVNSLLASQQQCTSINTASSSSCHGSINETVVVNVGEGRGYVSRVVAVCEGVPVVGLDCNPQHKEAALERMEPIIDVPSPAPGGRKDIVNLLYQTRGVSTCVTCRVDAGMDLGEVLDGAVRMIRDGEDTTEEEHSETAATTTTLAEDDLITTPFSVDGQQLQQGGNQQSSGMMSKVLCTGCDKVMRVQNGAAIVKHGLRHAEIIQTHLDRKAKLHQLIDEAKKTLTVGTSSPSSYVDTEAVKTSLKSMEEEHQKVVADPNSPFLDIHNWRQNLSPEALLQQVVSNCFKSVTLGANKRPREDGDGEADDTPSISFVNYQRGVMLQIVMTSAPWTYDPKLEPLRLERHMTVTVLGRDDSSKRYKVFVHSDELRIDNRQFNNDVRMMMDGLMSRFGPKESSNLKGRTRMMNLLDGTDCTGDSKGLADFTANFVKATRKAATGAPSIAEATTLTSSSEDVAVVCTPSGFVQSVQSLVPPPVVRTPLRIPSLSNSFMIGLHTCGDLGSNICRMFSRSEAPLLLLVSCCWHALTPSGFPLSAVAQGSTTPVRANALSLMLATQPLDMLGQSGGDEHLGSLRLLFFRSLFSLLWTRLGHTIWSEVNCTISEAGGMDAKCHVSTFLEAFELEKPQLDRSFLRALAKDKKSISFVEMCTRIRDKYLSTPAMMEAILSNMMTKIGIDTKRCVDDDDVSSSRCVVSRLAASLHKNLSSIGNDDNIGTGAVTASSSAQEPPVATTTPFILQAAAVNDDYLASHFIPFVGFTVLRMWMSHVMEGYLLVDRILYLAEEEEKKQHTAAARSGYNRTAFSLTPLFDGALSPRMYAIMGLRQQQTQQ